MPFGEICEPSTRALNGDDYEFIPEVDTPLKWEGEVVVPDDLKQLIFIESSRLLKIFGKLLSNSKPLCQLPKGCVKIYNRDDGIYIISYVEGQFTTGEIIASLSQWIEKASQIDALTTGSLVTFLTKTNSDANEVVLRNLATPNRKTFPCHKLEQPNIVTGLGAEVLSYSLFMRYECALYVFYMFSTPLDSVNTRPVLDLMSSIGLDINKEPLEDITFGNLYT